MARPKFGSDRKLTLLPKFVEETIPHKQLTTHPWNFYTKKESSILKKLNSSQTYSIEEVFTDIKQGIRTGAKNVFVIDNKIKKTLEANCIKNYVSGEDIKDIKIKQTDQFIIYPYIFRDGGAISFTEKSANFVYLFL